MTHEDDIERAAIAILAVDNPNASGWSGKEPAVKEHYRRLAHAALASREGVTCEYVCGVEGHFSAGHSPLADDDGRPFVFVDGRWLCARHADEFDAEQP